MGEAVSNLCPPLKARILGEKKGLVVIVVAAVIVGVKWILDFPAENGFH